MLKTIKFIFYVLAIIVIAASVYIATLPSKFEHVYSVHFDKIPKQIIKNKLLKFEHWKDWAIKDTNQFKVTKSKDPLQSMLQSSLVNKQEFKLENEQINDSIIVQKMYTSNEQTIQTLTWNLGNYRTVEKMTLELKEELSFSDKLYELLNWKNGKRTWLLNLENRLGFLEQQVSEKSSEYVIGKVNKSTFGPIHYIYVSGSGNVNHLMDQTQEHIMKLEQFLAEQQKQSVGKPFTIYNNDLTNGDVIFSTALPISDSIPIKVGSQIRYGFIDGSEVYSLKVKGNPENIASIWKNFKQSKELTLTEMSDQKYLLHNTFANYTDYKSKEQELLWKILTKKEVDTLSRLTEVVKDSLF